MAVALLSKDVEVHASAVMVVVDAYPRMMIAVIDNNWPPKQVLRLTRNDRSFMQKISQLERNMISTLDVTGYNNLDVTCIYHLIRHFKLLPVPNQGWGNKPLKGDIKEEDDVERIRTLRNDILHRPRCGLSEQDRTHFFQESYDMAKRLDINLGSPMNGFESQIKAIQWFSVDRQKYIKALENCADYQAQLQKIKDTPNMDLYYGNDIMMKFGSTDNQDENGDSRCSIYMRDQSLDVNAVIQNIDEIKKTLETGNYNVIKLDGAAIGSLILHISIPNTLFVTKETLHDSLQSFLHHFFLIAGIQYKTAHVFTLVLAESDIYPPENDKQDLEYLSETPLPILKLDVNVPNSAFQNENVLYKDVNSFITGMYDAININGVPVNGSQREVIMLTRPENEIKRQLKEPDTDGIEKRVSSYKLKSEQTVDLIGQKYVTNTNLEPDYEVPEVNLLAKRKIDESCIKVREEDAKTQSHFGHIELNSPFIKNVKKEKAIEVCQTPDQMRNILASGADDISKDMDIEDHWRKLILELCRGQIVKNVVPSSLLTSLGPIFSSDEQRFILSLERQDSTKSAMNELLEMIDQKDYQGKWQIFKQSLINNEYEWFNDSIEHDVSSHKDTHVWEYLLSLFEKRLAETINPLDILQYLTEKSIISEKDSLDVYQLCRKYGDNAATLQLLTYLPKRRPKVWYPEFMKILYENGYECIVQEIDPEQYENLSSIDVHKTPEPTEIDNKNTENDKPENYMPAAQVADIDYNWRKLIMELCHRQIVKTVIPSSLLTNLGALFSLDEKRSIRSLERMDSPQSAMEKLLEMIDEKEFKGKWQIFKKALHENDYGWVIDSNSYKGSHKWENMINVFEKTLCENIRPQDILPYLRKRSIISDKDLQDVDQICRKYGGNAAMFRLLFYLPKRKPNAWYPEFMKILYENGYDDLVKELDPDEYKRAQDVNLDDHWRKLIMELCRKEIVKNVRPSGLLTHLGPIFSWDEKSSIRSLERMESPQSAMDKLLEKLDERDYEGKWQIFKQALKEDGYEWVNEFIEGDFVSFEDTRHWENLIHVFEKTLSVNIRPQEILCLLRTTSILSQKDLEEVEQVCRNHGETGAMLHLLAYLPNRKPNTWFPEFMEILYECGYADVVKEVDPDMYEKLCRSFVKSDKLDNDETVNYTEGYQTYKEYDRKEMYMSVQHEASSYNSNFPRIVGVVKPQPVTNVNVDHDDFKKPKEEHFAKRKVDECYNKLSEEDADSQTDSRRLEVDSLFVENVKRNIAMKVWPEVISNKLGSKVENCYQDSDTDDEIVKEELRIRDYQMELAKPALDHKNCIIVAPTGSGKIYVALKIIQDHMEKTIDRFPKVLFLVQQSALAKQQADKCKKYLSNYRVKLVTGEIQRDAKIPKSLSSWLNKKDILIATAQLVVNALKHDEIKVEDFTLMVFDECYHARASHPYAEIMHKYMDLKLGENVDRQKLPLVVGLTASFGVGRVNPHDENKYIPRMMANLDAEELSTVKKCLTELTEHAIVVQQETISTVERKKNYFGETLVVMMDTIESYMRNSSYTSFLPDNEIISKGPGDKGSDTYKQWISELGRETAKINRQDARRYFETCRLYLDLYNKVLTIYEDARVEDAILFLEQYLKCINEGVKPDATDDKMLKIYQEGNRILAACVGNVYHINPKLIALRDIIFKLYKEKPDSKVIMFIKTREVVQAIENWMKDTDGLSYLKPVNVAFTHATGEKGGMTKIEQDGILKKFRTGEHKIILAISVAEEELEILTCTLVIKYDHATHEIALIQTKGRSRAEGNTMVAQASEKKMYFEEEKINLIRETKMNEAIKKVQKNLSRNKVQFLEDVEKIQRSEKRKRDLEKLSKKKGITRNSEFVLRCGKCSSYICISSDIKKIQDAHHAVINDDVRNSITTEKSEAKRIDAYTTCGVGKVKCKNCGKVLGNVTIHQGAEFPVLKIDNFLVADSDGKTYVYKRWKSVPFCPHPMLDADLKLRLQGRPYVQE